MDQSEIDHMLNEKAVGNEHFKDAFKQVAIPIAACMLVLAACMMVNAMLF